MPLQGTLAGCKQPSVTLTGVGLPDSLEHEGDGRTKGLGLKCDSTPCQGALPLQGSTAFPLRWC